MREQVALPLILLLLTIAPTVSIAAASSEPPTLISAPMKRPVTLDGMATGPTEWAESKPVDVQLGVGCCPPVAPFISARAWSKFDSTWIYFLFRITWPASDVDQDDLSSIEYFWGHYGPPWEHSDSGWVSVGGTTGDEYGWDDAEWYDDEASGGQNNVEGAATHDGIYYWFEFKKALNSGDGFDWTLERGHTYGLRDVSKGIYGGDLIFGLWSTTKQEFSLAYIKLQIPPAGIAVRESALVTALGNAVTIDGKWTTAEEWSDTNRISMYLTQGSQGTGYVRFKHDSGFVYVLVDFISDTTSATKQTGGKPPADQLNISIDKDVYDTTTTSDVSVQLSWMNGKSAPEEINLPWIQGTVSYDSTNDPDSKTPHATYELAVALATFEKKSAMRISVWDPSKGVNMHWPKYQGSWSTDYFGDLQFSEVVVPELPFNPGLVLLAAVAATFLFLKRRRLDGGRVPLLR